MMMAAVMVEAASSEVHVAVTGLPRQGVLWNGW
jgi:hypothetical protein